MKAHEKKVIPFGVWRFRNKAGRKFNKTRRGKSGRPRVPVG